MPGYSYGISANKCKIGGVLAKIKGSTCENCYALKGFYTYSNVKKAHSKRLRAIRSKRWVQNMALLVDHYSGNIPFFRWHDSGDLQTLEHLEKIVQVAKKTPSVNHWLPTREVGIVREYQRIHKDFPQNLCVRVSAPMVDGPPGKAFENTSTVHKALKPHGFACPAFTQGNQCKSCRACWDKGVKNVSYKAH